MKCDMEYDGSAIDFRLLPHDDPSFDSVYRCSLCPRIEVRNIANAVVYDYDPYDIPTCQRPVPLA